MTRGFIIALSVVVALAASCRKPGPDVPPAPESDNVFVINGCSHEVGTVALFQNETLGGCNLVLGGKGAPLCGLYGDTKNRAFSLISVDFLASSIGHTTTVGTDEIDGETWKFCMGVWDRDTYSGAQLDAPKSGSYRIETSGSEIKVELEIVFEDNEKVEIHYCGPFTTIYKYIWYGMSDGAAFAVDGDSFSVTSGFLYHDSVNRGYELQAFAGQDVFVVDFSELLAGQVSTVGTDNLSPDTDDNSVWSFMTVTVRDGVKVTYVDIDKVFKAGYLDCFQVTGDRIDLDMSVTTHDGHILDLHYHGPYRPATGLYR